MSWTNYGNGLDKWNIDHNLPCASFDMDKPQQQRICFHWSNQFPMWQRHNMAKSDSHWITDYVI